MKKHVIIFLVFFSFQTFVFSQTEEVNNCLRLVSDGKVDEAKIQLPELLAKYPDDAGVKFLHGVVLDDGSLAVSIYKDILSKYPKSEWIDDVYLRLVQYYSITGDTSEAKKYLDDFRKLFPDSEYLNFASNAVKVSVNQQSKHLNAVKVTMNQHTKDLNQEVLSGIEEDGDEKMGMEEGINEEQKPEVKEIFKEPVPAPTGKYALQVGIYSTQTAAKNEAGKYTKLRLVANVLPKKIGSATMYAVIIGEYKDRKTAEKAKPLVAKHCNCIPLIIEK
ncbi:MAG: SPOR domain-containing protein [bacterium]